MKAQFGKSWHLRFSYEPHKVLERSACESIGPKVTDPLQEMWSLSLTLERIGPKPRLLVFPLTLSVFQQVSERTTFHSFNTKCVLKCDPALKIIIETVNIISGEGNLWSNMKWFCFPPNFSYWNTTNWFSRFSSYCSNLKIICISIFFFLLTAVLWFFPLLSQVWISGNGHHSFLCLVVFLGCQWQGKCMH